MLLIAPYLLSLCDAAQESNLSFGLATRLNAENTTFNVEAAKLIRNIVKFSPAPEHIAIEFLQEFNNVQDIYHLVGPVLSRQSELGSHQWSQEVLKFFRNRSEQQLYVELTTVRGLASDYLTHLLITVRNPGLQKTPKESACSTPDILRLASQIQPLLDDAVTGLKQSALKQLIYGRDGYHCPFTDFSFDPQDDFVIPRCAHILPFHLHEMQASLRVIEAFTGNMLSAKTILDSINHPRNAFNVEANAHNSFSKLTWGIEAVDYDGQWKYIFRKLTRSAATIRRRDGDELIFNKGKHSMVIDGPDPAFCNLKLAIARALHACGAADIIAETYGDDDDDEAIVTQPVYFGGPFVSDDILCRRVDDRLSSYA